jgi:two-component system, OmpR family, phosphate regulon response regulator PhoB
MRILHVEDTPSSQLMVMEILSPLGHEIVVAATGQEALGHLKESEFHLILLDMGLPDQDGLDFCAKLQNQERTRGIPVMVITGRGNVTDKIAAFSLGVDDYVVKPFHVLEFRARVEAKLKKILKSQESEETIVRGPLTLNVPRQRVVITHSESDTEELSLTPLEFRLLFQLLRREEHVLTRTQLLDLAWGDSVDIMDRTVDAHISMLRKKLGNLSICIRAVAGEGYCFSLKHLSKSTARKNSR